MVFALRREHSIPALQHLVARVVVALRREHSIEEIIIIIVFIIGIFKHVAVVLEVLVLAGVDVLVGRQVLANKLRVVGQ